MADITGTTPTTHGRIDSFFAAIGRGLNAYAERRTRRGEIERLSALSDAELAKLGLTRDRIPHHVGCFCIKVREATRRIRPEAAFALAP